MHRPVVLAVEARPNVHSRLSGARDAWRLRPAVPRIAFIHDIQ
jgi:hypothetical protein